MKKRLCSLMLVVMMMISLLPHMAPAQAATHGHTLCGEGHCGCTSYSHSVQIWTAWDGTGKMYQTNGYYYLTEDVVLDSTMILDYSYTTYLCLNGHTITCADTVFDIYSYRNLHITDCVGTGKIETTGADSTICNNKMLSLWGGTILNSGGGHAVSAYASTNTYIRGGRVESTDYDAIEAYPGSNIRIEEGEVHTGAYSCYAISGFGSTTGQSSLTISGGSVTGSGNSSNNIVLNIYGNFTMSGGTVGGDVEVYDQTGTTTISGGTIAGQLGCHSQLLSITGGSMGLWTYAEKTTISAGTFHKNVFGRCTVGGNDVTITGGNFSACDQVNLGKAWVSGGTFGTFYVSDAPLYLSGVPSISTIETTAPGLIYAQNPDGTGSFGGDPIDVTLLTDSTTWADGDTIVQNVSSDAVAGRFVLTGDDTHWRRLVRSGDDLVLEIVPHGTWGNNVSWGVENGILTISGTGAIHADYSGHEYPWYDYRDQFTEIVVGAGITEIPRYTFEYLEDVTSITLPDTLTNLEFNAFNDCGSLNNLLLPASLTSAGGNNTSNFIRCESLTDVYYLGTEEEWDALPNSENVVSINSDMTLHFLQLQKGSATCTEAGTAPYYQFDDTSVYDSLYDLDKQVITALETTPAMGHDWGATTYAWADDGSTCTAARICGNDTSHAETAEAVITSEVAKEPTSTEMGETTYTAVFTVDWAEMQILTLADIPMIAVPGGVSTAAANLDLANGSIVITQEDNITTFTQGDTEIRTTAGAGIIRQSNNTTATTNTITVGNGTVNLTISGIHIASASGAPIDVKPGAVLTLTLLSDNTVVAPKSEAGVHVATGAELIIRGTGSLTATGGEQRSGIGSKYAGEGSKIIIESGTITATGGAYGAGIGGGNSTDGGNIAINGGTVTATGGKYGAGIGGGYLGDGGEITINGGTITAKGGYNSSGIGGGYYGNGGNITINGGTVIAISRGKYGASIGGGDLGKGGNVVIKNAKVTARGPANAIGGSSVSNEYGCDSVVIDSSATVELSYASSNGVNVREKITDNTVLSDSVVLTGNTITWTADAYGFSGLTYQWQSSPDNSTWSDVAGETNQDLTITMSANNDGCHYRCKLTNGWGNTIYTNAAQAHILAFAKQPTSVNAALDELISFEVTPSCANVTYQWQRSYDDGMSWSDVVGETYSTLLVSATLAESDAKYRCVITAANSDSLASDVVEINLNIGQKVTYVIENWQQSPDGMDYLLVSHEVMEGIAGETVAAAEVFYEGFTLNTDKSKLSGTVMGDSSLVLNRYFDRKAYMITFETGGGTAVPAIEALHGAVIAAPAAPSRYGYTFGGWYVDAALSKEYIFSTMPMNDMIVYAKWEAIGTGRGIEYTINRMGMYDIDTHEEYQAIPQEQFLLEVEITNECSSEIDTILLVQYSPEGQMLGMQYLYGRINIGEAYIFGASINNRDGSIGRIKAFVVPHVGNMIPLAESMEIGAQEKAEAEEVITLTYEEYNAMSGDDQQKYFNSFANPADFFTWYNAAKAEYEANQNCAEIGTGGSIDLGGLVENQTA